MKKTIALLLVATGTAAFAHSGVTNPDVMNRMLGMSELAKQMKIIGTMHKGEAAFDADAVNAALAAIAEEASYIPSLFEVEALDPKSEALPAIWEEFGGFSEKADALRDMASGLAGTVAEPDDVVPVMHQIGQACSACHADYRAE